jgi:outer membrane protein OmpA-like peptidoglycan-associated protein
MKKIFLVLMWCLPFWVAGQQIDTAMHIKSIYFGGGSHFIDMDQINELYEWLDGFEYLEQYEVIIHSHTDDIGGVQYNQWLSQMRSSSVWQRLVEYPIVPEAIEIKDFGEFLPTYDNGTWLGKLKNRRADVILRPLTL